MELSAINPHSGGQGSGRMCALYDTNIGSELNNVPTKLYTFVDLVSLIYSDKTADKTSDLNFKPGATTH